MTLTKKILRVVLRVCACFLVCVVLRVFASLFCMFLFCVCLRVSICFAVFDCVLNCFSVVGSVFVCVL